jgi:hypothetical protein
MPKKQKLAPGQYIQKIVTKLSEIVGQPVWDEKVGKKTFLNKTWDSESQKEQFVTWLASELGRDKDFYAAFQAFGHRNNTKKNCEQLARLWENDFGPKNPVCEK